MNFKKLSTSIEILRPLNIFIAGISTSVAAILAGAGFSELKQIILAGVTATFIAGGANAINDYFDIEIDRVNKPLRPLPRGAITLNGVLLLWAVISFAGIAVNLFLNWGAFAIAVTAVVVLFLYSFYFKGTVLMGNVIVSCMTGLAFIYGGVVTGRIEYGVPPAVFAFLTNMAREIIKDVEDMEGDRQQNAITFPIRFGARAALILAAIVLGALIISTILFYYFAFYSDIFLYIVLIIDCTVAYVAISMWRDSTPKNMNRLSMILKIDMLIGLIAIYLGTIR
jgi:geranylgeranylglycerol-phosphate geranylgeranyltransferase